LLVLELLLVEVSKARDTLADDAEEEQEQKNYRETVFPQELDHEWMGA
jgi:hypothetical protein